jgi:hypothetical protein
MVTRELVQTELERLDKDELSEVYKFIKKNLVRPKPKTGKKSLMASLKAIKIDAPEDFAENHDLYVTGEKRV